MAGDPLGPTRPGLRNSPIAEVYRFVTSACRPGAANRPAVRLNLYRLGEANVRAQDYGFPDPNPTSKRSLPMNTQAFTAAALAATLAVGAFAAPQAQAGSPAPAPSIVDVASGVCEDTGQFCILVAAIEAADPAVAARLSSRGQLTVFAPTNQAFVDLLAELGLTGLDDPKLDQATLTQVLLYHVVPGRRTAASVLPSSQLRTLQGGTLQQAGGVLTDNRDRSATIVGTDVPASNGIIHTINRVVLP
jgi:uncharacterized surface protein with fasciclin (FAS1) repeats